MRRWLREQSLTLVFGGLFLAALTGQAFAGLAQYNEVQRADGYPVASLAEYLASPDFAADVTENWQSEYLQFLLFIVLTVWLLQRGSPESKPLDKAGRESDKDQLLGKHTLASSPLPARVGGWRASLYSNSLGLVMGLLFVATWGAQSVSGWVSHNEERLGRLQGPLSWEDYLVSADFWSRSLQNWQSEFLAVGSMAALSIYLRQRGSPESKPVGEPHGPTGTTG